MPYYCYEKRKSVPRIVKENVVTLPKENLSLMMLTPKDIAFLRGGVGEHLTTIDKINMGDILVKPGPTIEGLSFGGSLFKVLGRIDNVNGVDINSFILKEVSLDENGNIVDVATNRQKVTINKHICDRIGIEFQHGLELWPVETNFIRYQDFIEGKKKLPELNYSDMGTYPVDKTTGLVHKICVELTGFRIEISGGRITTPTGSELSLDDFFKTLRFTIGQVPVEYVPISPENKSTELLKVLRFELDVQKAVGGISPDALKGKDVDDVITCTWVEPIEINPIALIDPHAMPARRPRVAPYSKSREMEIFEKLNKSMALFEREMESMENMFNNNKFFK